MKGQEQKRKIRSVTHDAVDGLLLLSVYLLVQ